MIIAFAGTDDFASRVLSALIADFEIAYVITQPDRPRGRGLKTFPPSVKEEAIKHRIQVFQFEKLNEDAKTILEKEAGDADLLVVCSYGLFIPRWLREFYKYGAINLHPSLLPEYRGASPIQAALMDGKEKTGVSIIDVTDEMDAGDVYGQVEVEVDPEDNFLTLSQKLVEAGASLLKKVIGEIEKGTYEKHPQEGTPTFTKKITRDQTVINWGNSCEKIKNLIRAFSPKPGAETFFRGKRIKILKAKEADDVPKGMNVPGQLIVMGKKRLYVSTGDGLLEVLELKPEGKREMTAAEFIQGYRPVEGEIFEKELKN